MRHDELCNASDFEPYLCRCATIAVIRADERIKVADRIAKMFENTSEPMMLAATLAAVYAGEY